MEEDLTLDGNAIAGALFELFGTEMTVAIGVCDNCANVAAVGALRAYTRGPGIVLRCTACAEVMIRVAQTPRGTFVEMRGTRRMRLPPSAG